jgi:predicted Zn-dependent protease
VAQHPPERDARAVRLATLAFAVVTAAAFVAGFANGKLAPSSNARPTPPSNASSTLRPSALPVAPVAGRTLYFAPFDDFPADRVTMLVEYYRTKYGVEAKVLRPAALDPNAWDNERGQVVAESVLASLKAVHGEVASDPGAVIIALVTSDVYIREQPNWRWAFGLRGEEGRFAVVSTARMSWPGGSVGEASVPARLRKMVGKDVGLMYFGLSVSSDPHSVLYWSVGGIGDLDRMGEDF